MEDPTPANVSDTIRYQGKAVEDSEWIVEFLTDQKAGVVGFIDGETPHLVTQLFVYDDDRGMLYLHGAQAGRVYDIVTAAEPARAAFTTSEMGRFVPAQEPVNFTVEYASVVAYGAIEFIEDRQEKQAILERFMAKFAPQLTAGEDYDEMTNASIDRTAVYGFDVKSWSGKRGMKDPDHPEAYDLDAVRPPNQ